MKKTIVLSSLLVVCTILLAGFINSSDKASITNTRTEEYAIVDVIDYGKKKIIRVTVGEEPVQEKEWEKTKTETDADFTPAIKELHALNAKGFEIVNSSLAYTSPQVSGGYAASGYPRSTFFLKKKL